MTGSGPSSSGQSPGDTRVSRPGRGPRIARSRSRSDVPVRQDVPPLDQLVDDRVGALLDRELAGVDRDLGVERRLVGVVDAGEPLDLAGAGLGVEALDVA